MVHRIRTDPRTVLGLVSGGHFLSHFYKLALPPVFPLLSTDFGLSNAELGLLMSVLVIGGLLQAPVGNVVDRLGAKWVFVAGVGLTAAGIGLVGLGPTYPSLVLLAGVSGLGQSAFHPADYALIDTVTDPGLRGRAFSVHTFCGYAGYAAAPVVVGTLAVSVGWRVALFVVGSVGLAYAAVAAVALAPAYREIIDGEDAATPADTDSSQSTLAVVLRPGIAAMVAFFLVAAFANKGIQSFTPVLAVDAFGLTEPAGNALLTVFFAVGSVGVLVGGVLADRYRPGRVIGGTLWAGATVLLLIVTGVLPTEGWSLAAFFGLAGFFISLIAPSRDSLVNELSASGSMGQSFGLVFTGASVGALVGPVVLGGVADFGSITTTFLVVGVLYLFAGGFAFSLDGGFLDDERTGAPDAGD